MNRSNVVTKYNFLASDVILFPTSLQFIFYILSADNKQSVFTGNYRIGYILHLDFIFVD